MMDMSVYDFHTMQNLAYDPILGRDFLQMNRTSIDSTTTTSPLKDPQTTGRFESAIQVCLF